MNRMPMGLEDIMTTRRMTCLGCGIEGELEAHILHEVEPSRLFRNLGYNPFSGHLHYQCPVCKIVFLVDPLNVWDDVVISPFALRHRKKGHMRRAGKLFQMRSLLQELLQNHQEGYC